MSTGEPPPNTSVRQTARLLQRSGLVLLGTGFLVAVAAAAVIGQRVTHLETAATAVHKVGLFVLLAGFCLLLSSYRVRQLLDWLQRRGLTDKRTRPQITWRTVFCSGEGVVFVGVIGGVIAMFAVPLPPRLGFGLALGLAILTPAMLTVMLVYTKGWRRAFCIGALFPAGVALFCAMSFVNPAVGWLSRYGVNPSESAEFVLRFQVLIAGCLGLMFVSGTLAVVLLLLLTPSLGERDAQR